VPQSLLQRAVQDRTTSKQALVEKLRQLDESVLVVEHCDPKPSDWKKQVAAVLVRPSERRLIVASGAATDDEVQVRVTDRAGLCASFV
jgi:bifunctional ADP-heptose synthase (sugar kinase/adenylyltransferase)